jgi:type II pantothenate kinase
VTESRGRHIVTDAVMPRLDLLPAGATGIDAGMTLTKVARATAGGIVLEAHETSVPDSRHAEPMSVREAGAPVGVTGARGGALADGAGITHVPEIAAGARGASALLATENRLGDGAFLLVMLGTGTAFAAVRSGTAHHLGGTPMGGGSFAGIARRVDPALTYEEMIAGAERGDRRRVDVMISEVYPEGIGGVRPDLTAAHLARAGAGTLDDFLAGLLNLHGENIAQIAAGRAQAVKLTRIVLAGGFVHNNELLAVSIVSMAALFGMIVEVAPWPGYAGALGAALVAAGA